MMSARRRGRCGVECGRIRCSFRRCRCRCRVGVGLARGRWRHPCWAAPTARSANAASRGKRTNRRGRRHVTIDGRDGCVSSRLRVVSRLARRRCACSCSSLTLLRSARSNWSQAERSAATIFRRTRDMTDTSGGGQRAHTRARILPTHPSSTYEFVCVWCRSRLLSRGCVVSVESDRPLCASAPGGCAGGRTTSSSRVDSSSSSAARRRVASCTLEEGRKESKGV